MADLLRQRYRDRFLLLPHKQLDVVELQVPDTVDPAESWREHVQWGETAHLLGGEGQSCQDTEA